MSKDFTLWGCVATRRPLVRSIQDLQPALGISSLAGEDGVPAIINQSLQQLRHRHVEGAGQALQRGGARVETSPSLEVREVTLREPGLARELLLREVALFPQQHPSLSYRRTSRTGDAARGGNHDQAHTSPRLRPGVGGVLQRARSPHVLVRSPAARPRGLYWGLTPVRFSAATHPMLPLDAPSRTRTPTRSVHGDLESGSSCTLVPGSR